MENREEYKAPPPYRQFNEPFDHRKPPPMHNQQQRMRMDDPKMLTEDERQILYGCRRDSFWQRSLPLSIGCFIGLRMAQQKGFVKWSVWKDFSALFGGYLIGKASFIPVCKRRIVEQLPDSNLARAITGEKLIDTYGSVGVNRETNQPSAVQNGEDIYTNTNIDTHNRPQYDLDSNRLHADSDQVQQEPPEPVKKSVTYDELRQMNRQKVRPIQRQDSYQYRIPTPESDTQNMDNDRISSQRGTSLSEQPQQDDEPRFKRRRPQFSPDSGSRNQYGDVWDKV